jgi:UDP-glucose 4-epimerase
LHSRVLTMSVVAVTGCSGYLGTRILRFLAGNDKVTRVIGIDNRQPRHLDDKLDFVNKDVRDPCLSTLFTDAGVGAVVHLAFVVNPIRDTGLMHDINVGGTANILRSAGDCGARHLTVASSTTAFGAFPDNTDWLDENDSPRRQPNYTYASDKYECERLAVSFAEDHPHSRVAIIRPCIVYGPHVDNYLSRFLLRLPFVPAVDGFRPQMQFVHEDDAAEVFIRVLEREEEGIFHAAGSGTVSTEDIALMAGKRLLGFPEWLIYPAVDFLWRLRSPWLEGPSGMLDFIRYRWTVSTDITRKRLQIERFQSTVDVLHLMLESHGVECRRPVSAGSSIPASSNASRLNTQLSHEPHGPESPGS